MKPEIYILKNKELEVHISTLGATMTRMITADKNGNPVDVLLGLEKAEEYGASGYQATGAYLGAMIGRYGNRIARGTFFLHGKEYNLAVNNGGNHLHGGICGFDKKDWSVINCGDVFLDLRYISLDGEEAYPGTLTVDVHFVLEGKALRIDYKAITDKDCHVNLTHHPYFNLNPGVPDIKGHILRLYSDRYLKTNDLIPDGTFVKAAGDYDFTKPQALKNVIENHGGLDDCYIYENDGEIKRLAELSEEHSGVRLCVSSSYPGLQVYTGRFLNVSQAKGNRHYGAYGGVALEAQFWPDSPNHPDFPSTLLRPGEEYMKTTIYGFN